MSEDNGAAPNNSSGEDRQFVHFSFYKLDRGFRALPPADREAALEEFAAVVDEFGERFPIRRMRPIDAYRGSDDRSMAADNTSAFNCRYAVAAGPKRWSVHAYGEAIDVNPVENPYLEGGKVRPAAGKPYLDRARARPGMAVRGGRLVAAFALVGWLWGGRWTGSPDFQHFSKTGG